MPQARDIDFLIDRLRSLTRLQNACVKGVGEHITLKPLSSNVLADLVTEAEEICVESETRPLSRNLATIADALADCAFLFVQAVDKGSRLVIAGNPVPTKDEAFLARFYRTPPAQNEEQVTLDRETFIQSLNYAQKARELLRTPLRKAGKDPAEYLDDVSKLL